MIPTIIPSALVFALLVSSGWQRAQGAVADPFEPDDSFREARPLALDGSLQRHNFHVDGDNDWVSFTLRANDQLRLHTTGTCDTYLYLYGSNGTTILAEDDDGGEGQNASIVFAARESGTYFGRVRLFGGGTCNSYELSGSATPVVAYAPDQFEPDDSPSQAKSLPLDGSPQVRSFHVPGDEDWVSFALNANDRVELSTVGRCETRFAFYGPGPGRSRTSGFASSQTPGGVTSTLDDTVQDGGAYYAQLQARGSTPTCESYELRGTVSTGSTPAGTPGITIETTIQVAPEVLETLRAPGQAAFEADLSECRPATFTASLGDFVVYVYEIIGPSGSLCSVKSNYVRNPNLTWIGPEMICDLDRRADLNAGAFEALNTPGRCRGPLYNLMMGVP